MATEDRGWLAEVLQRGAIVDEPAPSISLVRSLRAMFMDRYQGEPWAEWLLDMYSSRFILNDGTVSFASFHRDLWAWAWGIGPSRPRPFIGVWPRDTGKSTHAEAAAVYLGITGKRFYCLYVCSNQTRADDHVSNIAALLEDPSVERRYPDHAQRLLSKFNQSKGWRVNRVRTMGGFTVDAIGLDQAVRGARLEENRPDLIIIDDIDGRHDSPRAVTKKIEKLTDDVIPAGNRDTVAVLFVQNIVHGYSVMAQLVDGKLKMLSNKIISGPFKAIEGLTYETRTVIQDGQPRSKVFITGGQPLWDGLSLETCEQIIQDITIDAFKREYQQDRGAKRGALWTPEMISQHRVDRAPEDMKVVIVGIDPATAEAADQDETGIMVVGSSNGHAYVLKDASGRYSPDEWAKEALKQFDLWRASMIIAERNQGGAMVKSNILHARPMAPVDTVWAKRGKYTRAEPIVALYERGLVHHVGTFDMLEEQMCTPYDPSHPELMWDRMDALVWAVSKALPIDEDAHYEPEQNTYEPVELATPTYVGIDVDRVEQWRQQIETGAKLECDVSEWGSARKLLVTYLSLYARTGDIRGRFILDCLKEYDERYGKEV